MPGGGEILLRKISSKKVKSNNFIQRSIVAASACLKNLIFTEELALKNGFLQSLDPRIKFLSFLLLIIQVLLTKNISVLFYLYALCLFLALVSKINLGFFLKRTWIFIPLFSLFIAMPAIFSPGELIATLDILGIKLMISRQGLNGALIFVMRVVTCVSFAVILSITTKHFELLKVLRIFKVPQVFVMILGMCYRYIYLFVEIIEQTYVAIKSRVGVLVHYKSGQNIAAWNIAVFWRRSVKLNEDVYQAMLSRGYQGEAAAWHDFKIRARDWLWLFIIIIIIWKI